MSTPFIAFEGIDGSGKSTQLQLLAQRLTDEGRDVFVTCEPSNGPVGRLIRQSLRSDAALDAHTLALLFTADRLLHIKEMRAAIDGGQTVLSDRYVLSSMAYNGMDLSEDWVATLNAPVIERLLPDAAILIDITPEVAMERIRLRGDAAERYEKIDALAKIRAAYLRLAQTAPFPVHVLNGQQPVQALAEEIFVAISPWLKK